MVEIRTGDEHLTLSRQRQQVHARALSVHRAMNITVQSDFDGTVSEDFGKGLDVETKLECRGRERVP